MPRSVCAEWFCYNNKYVSCVSPRNAFRTPRWRWLATGLSLAAAVAAVLSSAPPARAGYATAGVTSPGDWSEDNVASAGPAATLYLRTFAGINGLGGLGLPTGTQFATPNVPNAGYCAVCEITLFSRHSSTTFGPGIWNSGPFGIAKAGLTSYAGIATTYAITGAFQAQGNARLSFLMPGRLIAQASTAAGAANNVRAAGQAVDPVPTPTGQYPYAAIIGGPDAYAVDEAGDLVSQPTGVKVDRPGEIATINFSADDSNDSTYLTTMSNAIWDFSITLTDTASGPELSAAFTDDPTRISIPGGPTNASQDQIYADELLNNLLSDTTDVSLTTSGPYGETLDINKPVTLFNGIYNAAISSPGAADPSHPGDLDFEYTAGAGVIEVPEPAIGPVVLLLGLLAGYWPRLRAMHRRPV